MAFAETPVRSKVWHHLQFTTIVLLSLLPDDLKRDSCNRFVLAPTSNMTDHTNPNAY